MQRLDWNRLDAEEKRQALARPELSASAELSAAVKQIILGVRREGDAALRRYTLDFDDCRIDEMRVPEQAFAAAASLLDPEVREAIEHALVNIRKFHESTRPENFRVEVTPGVVCQKQWRALQSVGLYVPGGTASLPSTMLMLGVPSELAGCSRRVLCTPPSPDGWPDPAILYAAALTGVTEAYTLGGAQAIAALAYGTESLPKVDKIFGPGNRWVTEAKQQVSREAAGPGIDMPAGPSELMIIADNSASPAWVAADLLSQAEHGPDSQVLLVTNSETLATRVEQELRKQLESLPRKEIASAALAGSRSIVVDGIETAVSIANAYAPEHLILNIADADQMLQGINSAGSVFLGPWSAEALGDYCSGTNHVLPTGGTARYLSGLSVVDFMRSMTVQDVSAEGLGRLAETAVSLARHEGLEAHGRAVSRRLEYLRSRASA